MKHVVNKSLVSQIHDVLREDIVSLRLAPGARIAVDAMARRFGVSRTPVRDALNWLVEERLVQLSPRVGYFVVQLTPQDVEEIADVRKMIELYALDRAFGRFEPGELEAMEQELEQTLALPDRRRREAFDRIDRRFHMRLIARSGNRRLQELAERIYVFVDIMRHLNVRPVEALHEHLAIVRAMRAGDRERATRLLAEHIDNVKAVILQDARARIASTDGTRRDDRNDRVEWQGRRRRAPS
ncbi:MAG: GntR family transcriptional regulator [Limnochordaceae bacterium]|nr:GntR family transcriptional regulator [Limnochordaceae bacterium]